MAERVYNTRETPEEKQAKAADRQTHNMVRILLAATGPDSGERERQLYHLAAEGKSRPRTRPALGKNQCDEKQGVAKGVLMQHLGPWKWPVAYLSKRLDPVASVWPPCLHMTAAVALMVKDADKLTLGQELHITAPHAIEGILKQPPGRWISNARLTHYQGLLLNSSRIIFLPPTALNPATLFPNPDLEALIHDCSDILAQVLVGRAVCTHTGAHAGRPASLREPGAGVSGAHLEASRLPQPTPIRSSLCIILICLWGPGRKVLRLLLYFGCKLQPPLYKLRVIESIRGSFF